MLGTQERPFQSLMIVALDSSQLGDLARDHAANDRETRLHAQRFETAMMANAAIPLICWHHLAELIQHGDDGVVERRLNYLRTRPALAWIAKADAEPGIGSIADLIGAEARAARAALDRGRDAMGVRTSAREALIRVGSGADALAPLEGLWDMLRPLVRDQAMHARQVVAITRGKGIPDLSKIRISDLAQRPMRSAGEREKVLAAMAGMLAADIATRGDRRIANVGEVANDFYTWVRREVAGLPIEGKNPIVADLLRRGARPEDFGPDTTIGHINRILEFRAKVQTAEQAVGFDLSSVQNLSDMDRIPSWLMESGLAVHGQPRPRNSGSDLNDRYLACLAYYANLTYVDGRTYEDLRLLRKQSPAVAALMGRVERRTTYAKAARHLTR